MGSIRGQGVLHVTSSNGTEKFVGTPQAIVRQMRDTDWMQPEKKRDYAEEVIERVTQITGVTAGATYEELGARGFLAYLERAGMIEIAEPEEQSNG